MDSLPYRPGWVSIIGQNKASQEAAMHYCDMSRDYSSGNLALELPPTTFTVIDFAKFWVEIRGRLGQLEFFVLAHDLL